MCWPLKENSQLSYQGNVYLVIAEGLQSGRASYGKLLASPQIKGEKHYKEKEEGGGWGAAVIESPLEGSESLGYKWFLIGWVAVFSYWLSLLLGMEKLLFSPTRVVRQASSC